MGKTTIDLSYCKGCGLCVSVCPKKILQLDAQALNAKGYHPAKIIDEAACIACGMCALICPDCAIRVEK